MGKVKQLRENEIEAVFDDLLAQKIDADEAVLRLEGFGVDHHDARDQVSEAYWEHNNP